MRFFLSLIGFIMMGSVAQAECKDPNLNGIKTDSYEKLQYLKRFEKIADVKTAMPAGFGKIFREDGEVCREMKAIYLKHYSGKMYIVYATNGDSCDGGNTQGLMIDMDKYTNGTFKLKDTVVGTIFDTYFSCKSVRTAK